MEGSRPRSGDELELVIDRLAYGGSGVARSNGYVVFVRGAVPGDTVRARVTRAKRSYAEADAVELREVVKHWCHSQGLSTYDRRSHAGLLRNLVLREGRRTGQLQARLVTSPGELDIASLAAALPTSSLLWTRAASPAETTRDGET